ncbi:hypothetical protein [Symbiopectobacterium sp. RP]|uniref:hypothetical protein n=1 Tax=Symbiopectobacterium sp. RP TaxID=3248553 RepID=UPI003D2B01BB
MMSVSIRKETARFPGNILVQINQHFHHNNASSLKRSANLAQTGEKTREKMREIAPDWCVFTVGRR